MARRRQQLKPLRITAELGSPLFLKGGRRIMLDALLAYSVALRAGKVALDSSMLEPIDIPLAKEPGGRFHLCSAGFGDAEQSELQYTNRRPPIEQYQMFGKPMRSVNIATGANKGYRIARPVDHIPIVEWWAVGDADAVADLLTSITHLGARRNVGLGRVERWDVEPCEPWGDGFPIVRDGYPMRPLPGEWPGLMNPPMAFSTLTYPYYLHENEAYHACPA